MKSEKVHRANREPLFTRDFVLLISGGFLFIFSQQMLIPILAIYTDSLGAQGWEVGFVIGAFSLAAMMSRLPMGRWVDRIGRKPLMLFGTIIYCIVPLLFIATDQVLSLFLLRLLQGVGIGAYTTAAMTMVADIAHPSRRGEVMGLYGAGTMSAVAAGPAFAGFFAAALGFTPTFLFASAIALVALFATIFTREKPRERVRELTGFSRSLREVAGDANVRMAAAGQVILATGWGVQVAFLPLYMSSLGLGMEMVGIYFFVLSVASISSRPFIGRLTDRFGRALFGIIGLVFAMLGLLLTSLSADVLGFAVCAAIFGIGQGTASASFAAQSVDTVSPSHHGMAVSMFFFGIDIGVTVGSAAFGTLTVLLSVPHVLAASSVVMGLGTIALSAYRLIGTHRRQGYEKLRGKDGLRKKLR